MLVVMNVTANLAKWGYTNDTHFINPMEPEFRPKPVNEEDFTVDAIMRKLDWFYHSDAYDLDWIPYGDSSDDYSDDYSNGYHSDDNYHSNDPSYDGHLDDSHWNNDGGDSYRPNFLPAAKQQIEPDTPSTLETVARALPTSIEESSSSTTTAPQLIAKSTRGPLGIARFFTAGQPFRDGTRPKNAD